MYIKSPVFDSLINFFYKKDGEFSKHKNDIKIGVYKNLLQTLSLGMNINNQFQEGDEHQLMLSQGLKEGRMWSMGFNAQINNIFNNILNINNDYRKSFANIWQHIWEVTNSVLNKCFEMHDLRLKLKFLQLKLENTQKIVAVMEQSRLNGNATDLDIFNEKADLLHLQTKITEINIKCNKLLNWLNLYGVVDCALNITLPSNNITHNTRLFLKRALGAYILMNPKEFNEYASLKPTLHSPVDIGCSFQANRNFRPKTPEGYANHPESFHYTVSMNAHLSINEVVNLCFLHKGDEKYFRYHQQQYHSKTQHTLEQVKQNKVNMQILQKHLEYTQQQIVNTQQLVQAGAETEVTLLKFINQHYDISQELERNELSLQQLNWELVGDYVVVLLLIQLLSK